MAQRLRGFRIVKNGFRIVLKSYIPSSYLVKYLNLEILVNLEDQLDLYTEINKPVL